MSRVSRATFSSSNARTFVVGIVLVLLLGGCQGGPTPSEPPSATSTTTAPPASSATTPIASAASSSSGAYRPADAKGKAQNVPVPVMPELAKENSKAGLEAFIGYYYAVANYASETGDITELEALSDPACGVCTSLNRAPLDSYRDGRWMVGGRVRIPTIEMQWDPTETSHLAKVQLLQDEISYYNADGTMGRPADKATNDAFVFVASYQSAWKLVDTGVIR